MARMYFDSEADLSVLDNRTVAIVGYGNQGRAHGLNLRDSGVSVIVGSIGDSSFDQAVEDGFRTVPISEAVLVGDVVSLLLPDEVLPAVYQQHIAPFLRPGQALSFAHGYSIHCGSIQPRDDVDVIMVAPRMIGVGVRESFVDGRGAAAFVAVDQDATGRAWEMALALAKGIGATRVGAMETTFAEETELDLFSEQAVWSSIIRLLMISFDFLVDQGYQPEAVLLELYRSGEPARIFEKIASVGLFRQMSLHSHTSQYGTLTRAPLMLPVSYNRRLAERLDEIRQGIFAAEWKAEQASDCKVFDRLRAEVLGHPINDVEDRLRDLLRDSVMS